MNLSLRSKQASQAEGSSNDTMKKMTFAKTAFNWCSSLKIKKIYILGSFRSGLASYFRLEGLVHRFRRERLSFEDIIFEWVRRRVMLKNHTYEHRSEVHVSKESDDEFGRQDLETNLFAIEI